MLARYEVDLPVVPGAVQAVRGLAEAGFRLALASSSNRELIDTVLRELGLTELFEVTVSSEEVARGKPAPDVYLEAAASARSRPGALRRGRGLRERDPFSARGGDARDRVSEPALPAGGRCARARRRDGDVRRRRRTGGGSNMTGRARRSDCPSCGGSSLAEILQWPDLPVNAALFPATRTESLSIPRGSVRLMVCERCGLVFNADHDESLVEYSPRCIETQACSPRSRAFTDALAREWVERHGLAGGDVVEVGCGPDATFLRALCDLTGGRGIGIDPACAPGTDGSVTLVAQAFGPQHAELAGRALVCRHTLEHVPEVGAFLGLVRAWSEANAGAPVLLELPDAGRIFRETAFWDVYYEHCSYFTGESLGTSLRLGGPSAGRGDDSRSTASTSWGMLVPDGDRNSSEEEARETVASAKEFGRAATRRIDRARDALRRLASHGPGRGLAGGRQGPRGAHADRRSATRSPPWSTATRQSAVSISRAPIGRSSAPPTWQRCGRRTSW